MQQLRWSGAEGYVGAAAAVVVAAVVVVVAVAWPQSYVGALLGITLECCLELRWSGVGGYVGALFGLARGAKFYNHFLTRVKINYKSFWTRISRFLKGVLICVFQGRFA